MSLFAEIEENRRFMKAGESGYNILRDRHSGLWSVVPAKGPLPEYLEGVYTSPQEAAQQILDYLHNRVVRRKKEV